MTTFYYYHEDFLLHNTGNNHPESADRLLAINALLKTLNGLIEITPIKREDSLDLVKLVHSNQLIDWVNHLKKNTGTVVDKRNDVVLSPDTAEVALLAVSACCDAVDQVITGHAQNAFCAVRPPGHHATPSESKGFCIYNNIAIAASYAIKKYNLQRVAIIDFDVHHGNGTQDAFYDNPKVFFSSTHEKGIYPYSGGINETGKYQNILNVPMQAGTDSNEFRKIYIEKIFPRLEAFNPEIILISAGFDAHEDDYLGSIKLQYDDYAWITRELVAIANKYCEGKIVSILEGGYELDSLAKSVKSHVIELL